MSYGDGTESLDDVTWDKKFFNLISYLFEKNASRYESQARTLLKNKTLKVSVDGIDIKYKITRIGCSSSASRNSKGYSSENWTKMGWRRSSKMKALPMFFAGSEAGVLLDLSE